MEPNLLTAADVAALLSVRPQTVRDAAWRGKLPFVRVWGGKKRSLLRFRREDIERLVAEHRAKPAAPAVGRFAPLEPEPGPATVAASERLEDQPGADSPS